MKVSKLAKGRRGRLPGVCPVCGSKLTHQVIVQAGKRRPNGKGVTDTVSRSITMCDEHAGDLWLLLAQQVDEARS